MDKLNVYLYVNYHLAIKNNEVLMYVKTCMDFENIILYEIIQTEDYMIPFTCNVQNRQIQRDKSRIVAA